MEFEYVCYPNPCVNRRVLSHHESLVDVLNSLVYPSDSQLVNPWYQTPLAQGHLGMIGSVVGSFYRLEFDPKCKIGKLPPCRDPEMVRQKKLVDACGELWVKTLRVLERMDLRGALPSMLILRQKAPIAFMQKVW
jgi:hypothetical protein